MSVSLLNVRAPARRTDCYQVGEIDQDSAEDKWYTGFILALTVGSLRFCQRHGYRSDTRQDWKIYLLMLSLTACIVGLSFNM